ncbi:MAG: hypothetical protein FWD74_09930 [Actinomycetia bacterium]|nr:hypothetical protein [Actinomycetes bacterium]
MSYDLQIYATTALPAAELRALVAAAGFGADDDVAGEGLLSVVRGARRAYCFTLGGPAGVKLEDIPEEIVAVLIGATCVFEVVVEGSSSTSIPHAVRFARRLAQAVGGAVLDRQTGATWSRGKLRACAPVERGVISVVELCLYVAVPFDPADTAAAWTALSRRYLPEALPRRYGTLEPLRHKLQDGGDAAFRDFVGQADYMVFTATTRPALDGSLGAGPDNGRKAAWHSLTVLRDALDEPGWRAAARAFFIEFARATNAVFASAEVIRAMEWSGLGLSLTAATERHISPAFGGGWAGLPPYPVWWSWFGADYAPLVAEHLPAQRIERHGTGLFHWRGEEPRDRDQLAAELPGAAAGSWLPAELLLVVNDPDCRWRTPSLTRARVLPIRLG